MEAPAGNPFGAPSEPPSFKGEDKLSSAILNVTEDRQTAVYFLTGHGEMGIEGDEEKDLNQFVLDLKRENCRVAALNLLKTPQMPADCDLLVIAGPEKPFTDSEVEILRQYLENNGRLFVLVHPRAPARQARRTRFAAGRLQRGRARRRDHPRAEPQPDGPDRDFLAAGSWTPTAATRSPTTSPG